MTLEKRIVLLEEELAQVKAELDKSKHIEQTLWTPNDDELYSYIDINGQICDEIFDSQSTFDCEVQNMNNVFKSTPNNHTHLQWYAYNVLRVHNKLMQLHELLCPDYFPDWNNNREYKYWIYFDNRQSKWKNRANITDYPFTVMFTYKAAEKACEILNTEKFMIGDSN